MAACIFSQLPASTHNCAECLGARLGDRVRKRGGDDYPGLVVSVFISSAGTISYLVELDPPFSERFWTLAEDELELRS